MTCFVLDFELLRVALQPLSLEELMRKRQAEALAASKPVFMTKKQREELALKKRADAVAAQHGAPKPGGGGGSAAGTANGHAAVPRRTEREVQDRRRDDDKRQRDEVRTTFAAPSGDCNMLRALAKQQMSHCKWQALGLAVPLPASAFHAFRGLSSKPLHTSPARLLGQPST